MPTTHTTAPHFRAAGSGRTAICSPQRLILAAGRLDRLAALGKPLLGAIVVGAFFALVPVGDAMAEPSEAPTQGHEQACEPVPLLKRSCVYDMTYEFPCGCTPFPKPGPLPDYGGCFLERSTITGDWGGSRSNLACRGFKAALQATHVTQYLASGGIDGPLAPDTDDFPTLGRARLTLTLDTERARLWRGGTLQVAADYRTGEDLMSKAPSLGFNNTVAITPLAPNDEVALTELCYTQVLSGNWAVMLGAIYAIGGDSNRFADGDGAEQFINFIFNIQAMYDFVFPTTTMGVNLVYFPTGNPAEITGMLTVFNAHNGESNPFEEWEGLIVQTSWVFGYHWNKLPGSHKFGVTYGHNPNWLNLNRRLTNPPAGGIPATKDESWSVDYNWWQYFKTYDGAPGKGWGGFARVGVSDGNPNPYHFSVSAGVGGELPWRCHRDTFGVGLYYINVTDAPAITDLLDDEFGFEAYYNFEVAPWLHVTLDAQVINSAVPATGTAVIFSLRTHWDF